jgi:hypothetical protein
LICVFVGFGSMDPQPPRVEVLDLGSILIQAAIRR